jgi:long-subunit acyl-CoA synthetase (AMP-forming)
MLNHYNIVAQATQMNREDKLLSWDTDSQLGLLPFFHIYVSLRNPISDVSLLTEYRA